jgi:PAS domain S-box-containing protein
MNSQLKVLLVEDSEDDALLIMRELKRERDDLSFQRVETQEEFVSILRDFVPDLILSDFSLPQFDGLSAFAIAQQTRPEVPFIMITGAMGEEWAIETLKRGVTDYVLKQRLSRLNPSVERALREANERFARQQAEEALKKSENLYRTIFENTGTASVIIDEDMIISLANDEYEKLSGYTKEELEGRKKWAEFVEKDDLAKMMEYHRLRSIDPHSVPKNYEFRFHNREGNAKDILLSVDVIPGTKRRVASLLDITSRKQIEKELKKRVRELEDFYDIAVGRELRMKELQDEIGALKKEMKKYKKN